MNDLLQAQKPQTKISLYVLNKKETQTMYYKDYIKEICQNPNQFDGLKGEKDERKEIMRARVQGFLTDKPLPDGFEEWVNRLLSSRCESPLDFEKDFNPKDGKETVYYRFNNKGPNRGFKFDETFKLESCQYWPESQFTEKKIYNSENEGLAWEVGTIPKGSITMKRHKPYNSAPVGAYYF